MNVSGGSAKLAEADFTFNVASWKPRVECRSTGSRGDLVISQPDGVGGFGNTEYRWDVKLNDGVLMDVVAKLGAGEARMDLGSLNLRNVELSMGAGEVRMDLRGNPRRSYDVRINGGVGEATIYLPRSVSVDVPGEFAGHHAFGRERRHWPDQHHRGVTIAGTTAADRAGRGFHPELPPGEPE